ncbi:MAG: META domain-containing protein [Candidatus Limnocylindrales bacterium]
MIRTIAGRTALATSATLAFALAGLPLQALSQSDDASEERPTDALTGVVWAVSRVGPAPPATDQTVRFEPDGGLVASSGCADYTGTYSLDGAALTVDSMRREFGSLQDCTFGESGSADLFVNIIEDAESWSIADGGQLSIEGGGRREGWTLTLESAGPAEAADDTASVDGTSAEDVAGTWRLETMDLGVAGRATMPDEIEITLSLEPDGSLRGSGSCSEYAGGFTLIGQGAVSLEDVAATEAGTCEAELADLQQLYLGILPVIDTVELEDGSLVLGAAAISAELIYDPVD